MAAHARINRRQARNARNRRVPRHLRDRSNPLEDLEPVEVFRRFRFMPETVLFIVNLLPNLARRTLRSLALPPVLQLLTTLRYLATGGMHMLIGDTVNLPRETVGRVVRQTTLLLTYLCTDYVKFEPSDSIKRGFSKIAGFPNVIGLVDGTHIRIRRPHTNENDYVNRKGYHSLNVQMCCDYRFRITSCNAQWPGSVHDSRIFRQSALCANFEAGQYDGLLLGDSGYGCRHFLMTPFLQPDNEAKIKFNESLCRTRVLIEQTFGILKRRFQILHVEQRVCPLQAATNTLACVVLHNIGILRGDIIPAEQLDENPEDPPTLNPGNEEGRAMREHIVQTFFS